MTKRRKESKGLKRCAGNPRYASEREGVRETVAAQAVQSMHASRNFARGIKPRDRTIVVVKASCAGVHRKAPGGVMDGESHFIGPVRGAVNGRAPDAAAFAVRRRSSPSFAVVVPECFQKGGRFQV